jgi:hypothetical protein
LLAVWPEQPEVFRQLGAGIADWDALLDAAERHAVVGVLYDPLRETAASIQARIEQRRAVERLWGARRVETLTAVLRRLEAEEIPVLPLKGPVLGERLYGDPLVRLSQDLDLLVPFAQVRPALAALEALGYRGEGGPAMRYHRRYHHHHRLDRPGGPLVELHFRLYVGFGRTIAAEPFLQRAGRYRTQSGGSCLILAPEDELLYLAIHAAGHACDRLGWLYDLKTFLACHPRLDWGTIAARARSHRVAVALGFALRVLRRRLGVEGPGAERSLGQPPDRWQLPEQLLSWLETVPATARRGKLGSLLLQASLCDRPSAALWYVQHHLGRMLRRRLHRYGPSVFPAEWSA